jgi:hypothetical protein
MATFPPIVVDNLSDLQNAVWHAGTGGSSPGWDTNNESGTWTFTNTNFTGLASATLMERVGFIGGTIDAGNPGKSVLKYVNGIWFMLGQNRKCRTSADGITWTSRTILGGIASSELFDVAWNGSVYCIVGGDIVGAANSSLISTSPDLITWTARTSPNTTHCYFGIAWNGTTFAAGGGKTNPSPTGTEITSADGIAWATQRGPTAFEIGRFMVWDGTNFIASFNSRVWTSPTGVTWTDRTGTLPDFTTYSLIVGSGVVVALDAQNGNKLATSIDHGITWVDRTATKPGGFDMSSSVCAWNGSIFMFISGFNKTIWTSPDAITWTQDTVFTAETSYANGIASNGVQFLAALSGLDGLLYSNY